METVSSEAGTKLLARLQGKFVKVCPLTVLYLYVCPSFHPFVLSKARIQQLEHH
jgi:hypothetical protein